MKRNESILVYGVTSLLVVILIIAVVFGNEDPPAALETAAKTEAGAPLGGESLMDDVVAGSEAADLEDIMNLDPAQGLRDAEGAGAAPDPAAPDPDAPDPGAPDPGAPDPGAPGPASPAGDGTAGETAAAGSPAEAASRPGENGLASNEPAAFGLTPQPAANGTMRVGDYRRVTVRAGDSLSTLVQRWCGTLDSMPLVEALNEDISPERLRVGRTVLLPWVEEAELAELRHRRPPEPDTSHTYTVRSGDSLWKIAVQATGDKRQAPGFVKRILEVNPALEPERLMVGQEIVLPRDDAGAK